MNTRLLADVDRMEQLRAVVTIVDVFGIVGERQASGLESGRRRTGADMWA